MRKKVVAMGLAAMMAMSLAACSSGGSSTSTTAAGSSAEATTAAAAASSEESKKEEAKGDGKGYVVALCNYSIGNSWRAQMEQEFVSEAEKLKSEGVVSEYYITNSNEDINKQISDMQDLITKKVDAIVITAASPTALAPVVEEATEAGIKVVSFDNVVDTDEQVATVGIDETEFGRIGAEWLAEKLDGKLNKNFWNKHGHVVIIYVFLVALMLLVSVFSRDFFTIGNFKNLLRTSFPLLMVALGQTLIILTGGIDLSLGGIVALANVVCVMTMNTESPVGFILPLIAAVVLGLVCGALNGVLVTRGNLAPIIVTIATTAIFDGCALLLMPKPGGSVHKAFSKFLTRGLKGAVPLILFLVILILVRTLTNQTPYGKALRAIGGSENAAYSTGVKVKKVKFIAYCLAGLLCAAAGIFLSAQMNSADATIGKNYAMNAITATVVGGTAMTGAVGDPLGTIAGVFIISIINNMLNLFGVSSFYQFVCQGLILILALSLSAMHKKH